MRRSGSRRSKIMIDEYEYIGLECYLMGINYHLIKIIGQGNRCNMKSTFKMKM